MQQTTDTGAYGIDNEYIESSESDTKGDVDQDREYTVVTNNKW